MRTLPKISSHLPSIYCFCFFFLSLVDGATSMISVLICMAAVPDRTVPVFTATNFSRKIKYSIFQPTGAGVGVRGMGEGARTRSEFLVHQGQTVYGELIGW